MFFRFHVSFFLSFFAFFIFFLMVPSLSARDFVTILPTNDNENYTWQNFEKFLDIREGSEVTGMSQLKQYFHRFGYLPFNGTNFTDIFDAHFQSALLRYQSKLGLPITGFLDSDTISQIMVPRCGVSDTVRVTATKGKLHTTKHFAYFPGQPRWAEETPMTLTYALSPENTIDYLKDSDIKAVFRRAFARWASVIPVNFTEAQEYWTADIKIGFYRGDHGDGEPFDGVLGVLGHAFSPESGRFHLDAAETWALDFRSEKSRVAIDLESVVTHEIGHILGLAHSTVKEAVMYPSLTPRTKKWNLRMDDVKGVQALYGSNPNFKFNSLLVSDTSSCEHSCLPSRWYKWATSFVILILCFLLS